MGDEIDDNHEEGGGEVVRGKTDNSKRVIKK